MIWHTREGQKSRLGLNWGWDNFSQPRLVLRWNTFNMKYCIYFRRRSNFVMGYILTQNKIKFPRYILDYYKERKESRYEKENN